MRQLFSLSTSTLSVRTMLRNVTAMALLDLSAAFDTVAILRHWFGVFRPTSGPTLVPIISYTPHSVCVHEWRNVGSAALLKALFSVLTFCFYTTVQNLFFSFRTTVLNLLCSFLHHCIKLTFSFCANVVFH